MKTRAELLAWKRQRLIAQCIAQRSDFALQMRPLTYTLESVDTGLRIMDRIRRHPGWIAAIAAGLVMITPRRLSLLLRFGTAALRTWRSIAPSVRMLTMNNGQGYEQSAYRGS